MNEPSVIARKQGRAGRLTLNRPKALHALNSDMISRMTKALIVWRDDPEVELIVVDHTEGTRGFCAGGDVRMLADSGAGDGHEACAFFAEEYRLNALIKEYPKPYVAIMDGITMGGGVGVSVHGTYRVATPSTLFAMPEVGIGLFPDVGGSWFLPRLSGMLGMWLALTGAKLRGLDVLAIGVGTHFIENPVGLSARLCSDGTKALEDSPTLAITSIADRLPEIDACFSEGSVEKILRCLDKGSWWAQEQADSIRMKSPLSLKIAHRQLHEGRSVTDFRENMRMEYRIATRLVRTGNFHEGVRAVLVDRDDQPDWKPENLQAVTPAMLDDFFASLGEDELDFIGE